MALLDYLHLNVDKGHKSYMNHAYSFFTIFDAVDQASLFRHLETEVGIMDTTRNIGNSC